MYTYCIDYIHTHTELVIYYTTFKYDYICIIHIYIYRERDTLYMYI